MFSERTGANKWHLVHSPAVTDFPPPGTEPPPPPGGFPPPPPSAFPPPAAYPPAAPPVYAPQMAMPSAADRVRNAWHGRAESDYIFDFATALGWTILTCGFYAIYVVYQLVRRSREHNLRRIELLDAATTFAWEQRARHRVSPTSCARTSSASRSR